MVKQIRGLTLGLTVVVLSACALFGKETPRSVKTVQLTEAGTPPGTSVGLYVGDTLEIILEGNASTGFVWDIGFIDSVVLHSLGDPAYTEIKATATVGGAGLYTFQFLAAGEGRVELKLIYHRPFETNVPPLKTFEVTVQVTP